MFDYVGPWPVSSGILVGPVVAHNNRNVLTHSPVMQFWGLTLSNHATGLTYGCSCLTEHSLHGTECSQF